MLFVCEKVKYMIKIKLKEILKDNKYSIKQVSEATGLSRSAISDILNEKTTSISFYSLDKLCSFLRCNVSKIIEYK